MAESAARTAPPRGVRRRDLGPATRRGRVRDSGVMPGAAAAAGHAAGPVRGPGQGIDRGDHRAGRSAVACRYRHRHHRQPAGRRRADARHLAGFDGATWQERWEAAGLNQRGPPVAGVRRRRPADALMHEPGHARCVPAGGPAQPGRVPGQPPGRVCRVVPARCKATRCWMSSSIFVDASERRHIAKLAAKFDTDGRDDGVRDRPGRPDPRGAAALRHREPAAAPVRTASRRRHFPAATPGTSCT